MKATKRIGLALQAALLLVLGGCDNFSLTDLLGAMSLSAADAVIPIGSSTELTVTGGTAPYEYEVTGVDLYQETSSLSLGSADSNGYSAGGAIGRIRITVSDADGAEANATVTVVPPTPALSAVPWQVMTGAMISWTYSDENIIDGFLLEVSEWEEDSSGNFLFTDSFRQVDSYPADARSGESGRLDETSKYTFRLYAVSGDFKSLPDDETISQ